MKKLKYLFLILIFIFTGCDTVSNQNENTKIELPTYVQRFEELERKQTAEMNKAKGYESDIIYRIIYDVDSIYNYIVQEFDSDVTDTTYSVGGLPVEIKTLEQIEEVDGSFVEYCQEKKYFSDQKYISRDDMSSDEIIKLNLYAYTNTSFNFYYTYDGNTSILNQICNIINIYGDSYMLLLRWFDGGCVGIEVKKDILLW